MTTIAYRDGALAADSRETSGCDDCGTFAASCQKIFRIGPYVVALQGDTTPGMSWLGWFQNAHVSPFRDEKPLPFLHRTESDLVDRFLDNGADFTAVVLCPDMRLFIYDEWGVPQQVTAPYYAVGSGAKVAMGAMFNGAGAVAAVEAACAHDPYTAGPVISSETL